MPPKEINKGLLSLLIRPETAMGLSMDLLRRQLPFNLYCMTNTTNQRLYQLQLHFRLWPIANLLMVGDVVVSNFQKFHPNDDPCQILMTLTAWAILWTIESTAHAMHKNLCLCPTS